MFSGHPFFFFFNDTATTEIYTLSLHDALPIYFCSRSASNGIASAAASAVRSPGCRPVRAGRSEEHTSELQSQSNLVCRLLLEKKKQHTFSGAPTSTPLMNRRNLTTTSVNPYTA